MPCKPIHSLFFWREARKQRVSIDLFDRARPPARFFEFSFSPPAPDQRRALQASHSQAAIMAQQAVPPPPVTIPNTNIASLGLLIADGTQLATPPTAAETKAVAARAAQAFLLSGVGQLAGQPLHAEMSCAAQVLAGHGIGTGFFKC